MRGLRLGVLLAWGGLLAACPAAPPVPCVTCGTECVDTQNDPRHCGSCGQACRTGETCRAGVCGCGTGQALCGSTCTNLQTDSTNCGTCGTTCPLGRTCVGGMCGCAMGQSPCGNACFNLQTDRANCGACGNTCRTEEACVDGACRTACPAGFSGCGLACFNLSIDRNNCGRCGNACTTAQTCVNGSCEVVCPAGQTACGMTCADLNTSAEHCGACNMPCAPANAAGAACVAGRCDFTACDAGFSDCDGDRRNGCERNTSADIANCGACGNVCRPVNVATATAALDASVLLPDGGLGVSACLPAGGVPCYASRLPDGGTTVALRPDYPVGVTCAASSCGYEQCIPGFLDCDGQRANGCERDVRSDVSSCGACNVRCSAGQSCLEGRCFTCRRTALLLTDGNPNLELALRSAGFTVTIINHSAYTGAPAADTFGVVFHAPANNFSTDMPLAGQQSIVAAVNSGRTGFVSAEWFHYLRFFFPSTFMTTLNPIAATTYREMSFGNTIPMTYSLEVPGHPLWDGVNTSFVLAANHYSAFSLDAPADGGTAIARCSGRCGIGVGVRTSPGRVVTLAFNVGYSIETVPNATWFNDPNLMALVTNSASWAAGCK